MDCAALVKARLPYTGIDGTLTRREMVLCASVGTSCLLSELVRETLAMKIILILANGNMYPLSILTVLHVEQLEFQVLS